MSSSDSGGAKAALSGGPADLLRRLLALGILVVIFLLYLPYYFGDRAPLFLDRDDLYITLAILLMLLLLSLVKRGEGGGSPPAAGHSITTTTGSGAAAGAGAAAAAGQLGAKQPPTKPPKPPKKKIKHKKKKKKGLPPLTGGGIGAGTGSTGPPITPPSTTGYTISLEPDFKPVVLYGRRIKLKATLKQNGNPINNTARKHLRFKIVNPGGAEVYDSPDGRRTDNGVAEMAADLHLYGPDFPEGDYTVYVWADEADVGIPLDPATPIGTFQVAKVKIEQNAPIWNAGDPPAEIDPGTLPSMAVDYPAGLDAADVPKFKFKLEAGATDVDHDDDMDIPPGIVTVNPPAGAPEFTVGSIYTYKLGPMEGDLCDAVEVKFKLKEEWEYDVEITTEKDRFTQGEPINVSAKVTKTLPGATTPTPENSVGVLKFEIADTSGHSNPAVEAPLAGEWTPVTLSSTDLEGDCTITVTYTIPGTNIDPIPVGEEDVHVAKAGLSFVLPAPDGTTEVDTDFKPKVEATIPGGTEHYVTLKISGPGLPTIDDGSLRAIGDPVLTSGGDVEATADVDISGLTKGEVYEISAILNGTPDSGGDELFTSIGCSASFTVKAEEVEARFIAPAPIPRDEDPETIRAADVQTHIEEGGRLDIDVELSPQVEEPPISFQYREQNRRDGVIIDGRIMDFDRIADTGWNIHTKPGAGIDISRASPGTYILDLFFDGELKTQTAFVIDPPTTYEVTLRANKQTFTRGEKANVVAKVYKRVGGSPRERIQDGEVTFVMTGGGVEPQETTAPIHSDADDGYLAHAELDTSAFEGRCEIVAKYESVTSSSILIQVTGASLEFTFPKQFDPARPDKRVKQTVLEKDGHFPIKVNATIPGGTTHEITAKIDPGDIPLGGTPCEKGDNVLSTPINTEVLDPGEYKLTAKLIGIPILDTKKLFNDVEKETFFRVRKKTKATFSKPTSISPDADPRTITTDSPITIAERGEHVQVQAAGEPLVDTKLIQVKIGQPKTSPGNYRTINIERNKFEEDAAGDKWKLVFNLPTGSLEKEVYILQLFVDGELVDMAAFKLRKKALYHLSVDYERPEGGSGPGGRFKNVTKGDEVPVHVVLTRDTLPADKADVKKIKLEITSDKGTPAASFSGDDNNKPVQRINPSSLVEADKDEHNLIATQQMFVLGDTQKFKIDAEVMLVGDVLLTATTEGNTRAGRLERGRAKGQELFGK